MLPTPSEEPAIRVMKELSSFNIARCQTRSHVEPHSSPVGIKILNGDDGPLDWRCQYSDMARDDAHHRMIQLENMSTDTGSA